MVIRTQLLLVVTCIVLAASGSEVAASDSDGTLFAFAARTAREQSMAASPVSASNKGVQLTPDQTHLLVSKDVGTERWSIALNPDDTVIGNVFLCDGSGPSFVWCSKTDDDHNPDFASRVVVWQCFGASGCAALPCGIDTQWPLIADHVQLTGAFFLP
jgi:hypothetical protein